MLTTMLLITGYVACAILSYGISLGYYCRRYAQLKYREAHDQAFPGLTGEALPRDAKGDAMFSATMALGGPISFLVALLQLAVAGYGLKFRWWVPEPYRAR